MRGRLRRRARHLPAAVSGVDTPYPYESRVETSRFVAGLAPGNKYRYRVWQWDSIPNTHGNNGLRVNGGAEVYTAQSSNQRDPVAEGTTTARADGTILFSFRRRMKHLALSVCRPST
jgi:hypothetical protein